MAKARLAIEHIGVGKPLGAAQLAGGGAVVAVGGDSPSLRTACSAPAIWMADAPMVMPIVSSANLSE
jgi:hypothetical protein